MYTLYVLTNTIKIKQNILRKNMYSMFEVSLGQFSDKMDVNKVV